MPELTFEQKVKSLVVDEYTNTVKDAKFTKYEIYDKIMTSDAGYTDQLNDELGIQLVDDRTFSEVEVRQWCMKNLYEQIEFMFRPIGMTRVEEEDDA